MVRYTTDVGISDNGRKLKGFSIREVEYNWVGVGIDDINLSDREENSLYISYGHFDPSCLSISQRYWFNF